METIVNYLLNSFLIACFSYVYIIILYDADKLLGTLYQPFLKLLDKTMVTRWLTKPLLTCVHCNAGQVSLWFYLIYYWNDYNLFQHIGFVSLTIVLVHILYTKMKY